MQDDCSSCCPKEEGARDGGFYFFQRTTDATDNLFSFLALFVWSVLKAELYARLICSDDIPVVQSYFSFPLSSPWRPLWKSKNGLTERALFILKKYEIASKMFLTIVDGKVLSWWNPSFFMNHVSKKLKLFNKETKSAKSSKPPLQMQRMWWICAILYSYKLEMVVFHNILHKYNDKLLREVELYYMQLTHIFNI